jgi:hypothetical protein
MLFFRNLKVALPSVLQGKQTTWLLDGCGTAARYCTRLSPIVRSFWVHQSLEHGGPLALPAVGMRHEQALKSSVHWADVRCKPQAGGF